MTMYDQNKRIIRDNDGNRWAMCILCGKVDNVQNFSCYGGRGQINKGKCTECIRSEEYDKL